MLSALAFYVITVIVKLLGDDEITQATAYSMLMLPSILLVFYPMCFGIQNDQDAKIVEIIFGIPNYSYKVWLLRLIISYVICFVITCFLALLTDLAIVSVPPMGLTLQAMVPALFIGTLSFMLSTMIKNGNGTSVVIIIIGLLFSMIQGAIGDSQWNIFLNPYDVPIDKNPQIFFNTVFHCRMNMLIASVLFIIFGLNNTRTKKKNTPPPAAAGGGGGGFFITHAPRVYPPTLANKPSYKSNLQLTCNRYSPAFLSFSLSLL